MARIRGCTPMPPDIPHATTEQLRHAIDSGATGDKVDAVDPAAAPLGTDEEAAGTPVPPEAAESALRDESRRPSVAKPHPFRVPMIVAVATAAAVALVTAATLAAL